MAFTVSTFLSESVLFIRDFLSSNITDPIQSVRTGRQRFVMTSYPKRETNYPIITVQANNINVQNRLGMKSEGTWNNINIEVRVWARNVKERDNLTEQVINALRQNQFGTGSSVEFGLHDFMLLSTIPINEEGESGIKSMVMEYQFKLILL